jgi:acetate---CoA ligase (ADP-forming)
MLTRASGGFADVSSILSPRSIVVVGASDRPGNFGGAAVRHLRKFRFKGPIWPVNRGGADVAELKAYASIGEIPEPADMAILAIPADGLMGAIRDCAARGIFSGIAFAGGLGEIGGAGLELQEAIATLCHDTNFILCGPNCVGIINSAGPVTATFATALDEIDELTAGSISMVSQSGGIGTTAFSLGLQAGFDFRHLISSGNEAVVDFSDYLAALARDEETRVIAGYLEGLKDGEKFMRALAEARDSGKPVVLIKSGATGAGARAALAHTGALAGEDRIFDAVIGEFGVIRAYSVKELVEIAAVLSGAHKGRSFGPGIGIATFGGGNGVIAADQCTQHGLDTPALGPDVAARLKPLLPSVATASNPLDLTPTTAFRDEYLSRLPDVFGVLAEEPTIDVLLLLVGTLASRAREITAVIDEIARRSPKPVCVAWPFPPSGLIEELAKRKIHAFGEVADAVRALSRLAARSERPSAPAGKPAASVDWGVPLLSSEMPIVISEDRCHAIMRRAGLPVADGRLVTSAAAAMDVATRLGFPVALKGISGRITHRAQAGMVILGAEDSDAARAAADSLFKRAEALRVRLEGVYVQKMETGPAELLVAALRDPLFGTMISCGSGGALAEVLDDVVIRRAPVDVTTAADMVGRLKIRRHARDAEGPLPAEGPAAFIARFSELAATAPWRRFTFEANPVKWRRGGVVAVDGLLIVEEM